MTGWHIDGLPSTAADDPTSSDLVRHTKTVHPQRLTTLRIVLLLAVLQQRHCLDTFKTVQAEYEDEGIQWTFIDFKDNSPVLELIEGRMGIITVLNEECMLPKGGDTTFTSKLTTLHGDHPHLTKDRLSKVRSRCIQRLRTNREGWSDRMSPTVSTEAAFS
jgi:hypothetical protein